MNNCAHLYEINDLKEFVKDKSSVFIYGAGEAQEYLRQYLNFLNIKTAGFVVSNDRTLEPGKPVFHLDDVLNTKNSGIILGLSDKFYDAVIPTLRQEQYSDYFILTEYSKRTIVNKMKAKKPDTFGVEINLADHCNLDCQMCDHYSPVASKVFLSRESFEKDIKRLSELSGGVLAFISLLGGEPLLHDEPWIFGQIARSYFPNTSINYYTNAILLAAKAADPLWSMCGECNIGIGITRYPGIKLDIERIEEKARKHNVKLEIFNESSDRRNPQEKTSFHSNLHLQKRTENPQIGSCYQFNFCNVLRNGRIYPCPNSAHIEHLNNRFGLNFSHESNDYIDIHNVSSFDEIAKFCASPHPFCYHCDIEKKISVRYKWSRSQMKAEEWIVHD